MSRFRSFAVRLANLFRRERLERELDAELQAYLELDIEENIRRGMAPKEARRTALARLGGVETVKEQCRDVRRFRVADDLWRDLIADGLLFRPPPFEAADRLHWIYDVNDEQGFTNRAATGSSSSPTASGSGATAPIRASSAARFSSTASRFPSLA